MTDNELQLHKIDLNEAPLPVVYQNAITAISECSNLDECKEWSNKSEAIASYARQAKDETMENMAKRIRARAIRRCGELLKMFDGRGRPELNRDGNDPNLSKNGIGENAGLSERQIKTANRLSNIPEYEFNNQIEQEQVPTLTKLSEQGKKAREYLAGPKPEGFATAIHFNGYLREVFDYTQKYDPEYMLNAMDENDKNKTLNMIAKIELWFDKFVVNA